MGLRASRAKLAQANNLPVRDPTVKEAAAYFRCVPHTIHKLLARYHLERERIHVGRSHRPMILLPPETIAMLRKHFRREPVN